MTEDQKAELWREDARKAANKKLLAKKDAEIARLRANGKRAAKAIDEFIEDLRMRASLDKRNIDPDGTVVMPIGNGVLYRLREARAALSSVTGGEE